MDLHKKPKVVFFAFHSATVLKKYWECMRDDFDCWWVTFSAYVHEDIKKFEKEKIIYKNFTIKPFRPGWLCAITRKLYGWYVGRQLLPSIIRIMHSLAPDIILTETKRPLLNYLPYAPHILKVLVFHSVPFKKYILEEEHFLFDLVVLPGEYHKKRICEKVKSADPTKMVVGGWPRLDNFFNSRMTKEGRDELTRSLGLDPVKKNILYAPTLGSFFNKQILSSAEGEEERGFEQFCRRIKELEVNLMVRLHPVDFRQIKDGRFRVIAKRYGIYWPAKVCTGHIEEGMENYLKMTDVLISDTSGIAMDYLTLDRPIIFIEPERGTVNWEETDVEKELRPGLVVNTLEDLLSAIKRSLINPQEFHAQRRATLEKVFYKPDGRSSGRAAEAIKNYYRSVKDNLK